MTCVRLVREKGLTKSKGVPTYPAIYPALPDEIEMLPDLEQANT